MAQKKPLNESSGPLSERRRHAYLLLERYRQEYKIDRVVTDKAFEIAQALMRVEDVFYIVPGDNAVQIEWHKEDLDVEVFIDGLDSPANGDNADTQQSEGGSDAQA